MSAVSGSLVAEFRKETHDILTRKASDLLGRECSIPPSQEDKLLLQRIARTVLWSLAETFKKKDPSFFTQREPLSIYNDAAQRVGGKPMPLTPDNPEELSIRFERASEQLGQIENCFLAKARFILKSSQTIREERKWLVREEMEMALANCG